MYFLFFKTGVFMGLRNIIVEDLDLLRRKSKKVLEFDVRLNVLLDDMKETLNYRRNAVGLAAPQIGVLRRVVVIDVGEGVIELVNPEIVETNGEQIGLEGCLSFPGQWGIVERPLRVSAKAQNREGEWFEITGEGLLARCLCHEIDHLNGVVFKNLASHMLTPEEVEEMIKKQQEAAAKAQQEQDTDGGEDSR